MTIRDGESVLFHSNLIIYIMAHRRFGTMLRDNAVHDMYEKELKELGEMACYVSKGYIYKTISDKTGLSTRTISYILNHTRKRNTDFT